MASAELTSAGLRDCRLRFGDFASARWLRCFLARFSFPFEVFLNRFAELLCVFIFGIYAPWGFSYTDSLSCSDAFAFRMFWIAFLSGLRIIVIFRPSSCGYAS